MNNWLITGATGNVGIPTLMALHYALEQEGILNACTLKAAIRTPADGIKLASLKAVVPVLFDFDDPNTHDIALEGINHVFLLRPPALADAEKSFKPFLNTAQKLGVQHITFLSVQGADINTWVPHYAIEQLIKDCGICYTFLRPAYFMQNWSTTLLHDLVHHQRVYLPAGAARFTLIHIQDLAEVATKVLLTPQKFMYQSMDVTNHELLSFSEMTSILNETCDTTITYISPNPVSFIWYKWRSGMPLMLSWVMVLLHYLPRFSSTPAVSMAAQKLLGKTRSFKDFCHEIAPLLHP